MVASAGSKHAEGVLDPTMRELSLKPLTIDEIPASLERQAEDVPTWKRALDLLVLALLMPVALPLMAGIAVGIYLVSPGPILFRQERVGLRGRRFTCLKFRSMVISADTTFHQKHLENLVQSKAPMTKMDSGDRRLIRFGSLFRATGLDELPQLFNILRGDMSLVGPRPCIPYEYEMYEEHQKQRFESLPGLTGLWQVSGKNTTTFDEMIELDIFYAHHKSLLLDLQILAKTLPAVIDQASACLKTPRSRNSRQADLTKKRNVFADFL